MRILTKNRYEQIKPTVIQSNNASISTPIYIGLITELNNEDVAANDARNAAMRQRRLQDARAPLKESKAPRYSYPFFNVYRGDCRATAGIPTTHLKSQSSNEVNRNREYKIRRAA